MIYSRATSEAFDRRAVTEFCCIDRARNSADDLTKPLPCVAMMQLHASQHLQNNTLSCVLLYSSTSPPKLVISKGPDPITAPPEADLPVKNDTSSSKDDI